MIKKSLFNDDKYLQLNRGFRKTNISVKSWTELKTLIHDINQAVKDEKVAWSKQLYSTWNGGQAVEVTKYLDRMYVGIFLFDKDGNRQKGKGMNLFVDEWEKCVELVPQIDQALRGFPDNWKYEPTYVPMYRFCDDTHTTSRWTFSLMRCYEHCLKQIPKPKPEDIKIQDDVMQLPDAEDLLCLTYTKLMKKVAKSLVHCIGCEVKHPSQKHHLDGCMMEYDSVILLHEQEAREKIQPGDVFKLYKEVRQALNIPIPQEALEEETVDVKKMKDVDITVQLPEVFEELFDTLMN